MIAAPRFSARIRPILVSLAALTLADVPFGASAVEVQGYDDGGGTFQSYVVPGVPVLDSFYFRFLEADHHIQAIQVDPASPIPNPNPQGSNVPPGQIFLAFMDNNRDDDYFYRVEHASVAPGVFRHKTFDYCRQTCRQWLNRPGRDFVFVITGFTFFFPGTDHHLRRVGIWEQDGELHVWFMDENGDDLFRYDLEYVYLPASMVARTGHVAGEDALGADVRTLDLGPRIVGPTVIRGFDFEFQPDLDWGITQDQHIKEIGVRTPGDKVEVYYADKEINDGGDRFNWGVDWAALRWEPVISPPRG